MPNNVSIILYISWYEMIDLEERISKRLKEEIELSGKTKSEIAKAIGVSKPTVSQYLSGRIMPSLTTFAKLCDFLDCSADDILKLK